MSHPKGCDVAWSILTTCDLSVLDTISSHLTEGDRLKEWSLDNKIRWSTVSNALKVGYGICKMPADFENAQLKWSYPLSFNADSDSTHSKYMDAQLCTSEQMRESEPLAS